MVVFPGERFLISRKAALILRRKRDLAEPRASLIEMTSAEFREERETHGARRGMKAGYFHRHRAISLCNSHLSRNSRATLARCYNREPAHATEGEDTLGQTD